MLMQITFCYNLIFVNQKHLCFDFRIFLTINKLLYFFCFIGHALINIVIERVTVIVIISTLKTYGTVDHSNDEFI